MNPFPACVSPLSGMRSLRSAASHVFLLTLPLPCPPFSLEKSVLFRFLPSSFSPYRRYMRQMHSAATCFHAGCRKIWGKYVTSATAQSHALLAFGRVASCWMHLVSRSIRNGRRAEHGRSPCGIQRRKRPVQHGATCGYRLVCARQIGRAHV